MTKKEVREAKAQLKRLNALIAKAEGQSPQGFKITENVQNTEAFGDRYVFIELGRDDLELRKTLKSIRYGATGRGKARWMKDLGLWSIKAEALNGTVFGS